MSAEKREPNWRICDTEPIAREPNSLSPTQGDETDLGLLDIAYVGRVIPTQAHICFRASPACHELGSLVCVKTRITSRFPFFRRHHVIGLTGTSEIPGILSVDEEAEMHVIGTQH